MRELLKEVESFSEEDRKAYMRMALTSLKTLHDAGYIHADIKPDNFLYSHGGRNTPFLLLSVRTCAVIAIVGLKLTDFGNAMHEDHKRNDVMMVVYYPRDDVFTKLGCVFSI